MFVWDYIFVSALECQDIVLVHRFVHTCVVHVWYVLFAMRMCEGENSIALTVHTSTKEWGWLSRLLGEGVESRYVQTWS